ncbi:MAG: hypothetical protein A2381_02010 [Bdellovibrionales bacterium RIFOXYB1_FULL_37_110]|nr:MAG: hypothetical protein A2417_13315 [Bdellovibrionales bacterium RIFOXYC1_FULL_37_79]OFZ59214.1 MAG: hypothetical protein A2381_02010 [Bdellovibrionales bacterium RIFOXYB1_FULL_37_110]OFZ62840.1 MAG: hypothetical protein A2577_10965 [Bdellovibrionales bacterium RIFOXYD1_FULL_36_51]
MALNILIIEPDNEWRDKVCSYLAGSSYATDCAFTGKMAQLKIYKTKFFAVIIDWETKDHSVIEVLKYINVNSPSSKVILTIKTPKVFDEIGIEKEMLTKIGVTDIITKPFTQDQLMRSIEGELQFSMWKNASKKKRDYSEEGTSIRARDDEFTRVKITEFLSGNKSVFDLFVRVSPNHYIKLLHAGDSFEPETIKKYRSEKNVEYLYFRTQDRGLYVRYMNKLLEKVMSMKSVSTTQKVSLIKNMTEKYVEEIYTNGIQPHLIEDGKDICKHIDSLIHEDPKLSNVIKQLQDFDPNAYSHAFLVVFFSSLICNKLSWATRGTLEKVTMGAMLHDIGKLKLSKTLSLLDTKDMSEEQLKEYKQHPQLGVDMLADMPSVKEPIKQIVFQHHETADGGGFPRGITGIKIYPLAQIVGLVDLCAVIMKRKKVKPVEAFTEMMRDEKNLQRFDQNLFVAFAQIFTTLEMPKGDKV